MGAARIRPATSSDLPGIAELMGARDGLGGPHPGASRAVLDLDPERIRVWVAVDGERIVAMTCAELRRLAVGDESRPAAYWTNLYIDEAYRDQMLYPRLPQTMLRDLYREGLGPVYAGVRRPRVLHGHLRIGFREASRQVVRLKPLRPLSLLAKRRALPSWMQRLAGLADVVVGMPFRLLGRGHDKAGRALVSLSPNRDAAELVDLLARCRMGRTARQWSVAELEERLQPAFDGGIYTVFGLRQGSELMGAAFYRTVELEGGIRVGVLLDVVARDGEPGVLRALLGEVERRLRRQRLDGLLWLDGQDSATSAVFRRAGFLDARERYVMIVGPKRAVTEGDALLAADRWRFTLLEHDAF